MWFSEAVIEARALTKDYGEKRAVDDLSFEVRPGIVTGSITHDPHSLAPWAGFPLFCGYAAVTLAVAAALLVRRDT